MSGIYIPNIEMPKEKPIVIYPDGTVSELYGMILDATPISVPDHGDLIDRRALMEGEGRYFISLCKEGIDVEEILRAKTIIPASKEE